MATAEWLLVLLAAAFLAISITEHKVFASRTKEHDDILYRVSKEGQKFECKPQCENWCSDTKYRKPSLFFCNKCYNTFLCVPSDFYGHKYECPCYTNWTTKEGGPKCP